MSAVISFTVPGGLSPRRRGNLSRLTAYSSGPGLSPDMRRVNGRIATHSLSTPRLSPHTGGELQALHLAPRIRRFIPAYTGGDLAAARVGFLCWGLSPRIRGHMPGPLGHWRWRGLSPRLRGENSWLFAARWQNTGLLPRTRGKRNHARSGTADLKCIPAQAGGNLSTSARFFPVPGLSPRGRGELQGASEWTPDQKVYPRARGGTWRGWIGWAIAQVYPRVGGAKRYRLVPHRK